MKNTSKKQQALLAAAAIALGTLAMEGDVGAAIVGYLNNERGEVVNRDTDRCRRASAWTAAPTAAECGPGPMLKLAVAEPDLVIDAPAPRAEKVILTADTLFDFDKSVIKPAGKDALDGLVRKIEGDLRVIISTGHTDSTRGDAYNMALSLRRAKAVKAHLVSKGIDEDRIYTAGRGGREPVGNNATREGRAQDRRVEIEILATP